MSQGPAKRNRQEVPAGQSKVCEGVSRATYREVILLLQHGEEWLSRSCVTNSMSDFCQFPLCSEYCSD